MRRKIEGVSISDIHLGHPRTPTAFIINNLDKHVTNDAVFSAIDLIVFAGDVFDQLLDFASDESNDIKRWIASTLRLAYKHDVEVVVLEGTPSHDRKQSSAFVTINQINQRAGFGPAKLHYVDQLSVLRLTNLGVTALMVPDEWGPTPADTLRQVYELLEREELTKVDFAFMHGMFEYQLDFDGIAAHSSKAYLDIVQYLIFIGHVHKYSSLERIFSHGSFDRLAQGEEEPKGYLRFTLETDGTYEVRFVENDSAATYKTIELEGGDITELLMELEDSVRDIPNTSYLRLMLNKGNALASNTALVEKRWPQFIWSFASKDANVKKSKTLIDHKAKYIPIQIGKQNIRDIMSARLREKGFETDVVDRCNSCLTEAL